MESQMTHVHPRAHGETHEQEEPHIVGRHNEGEDEHNHEKKSVLKKVKAKAKKIKDTLKKHGHGHGNNHDHDHFSDDHDLDEEDEEEEEMVEDPEIHGAPIYEAEAIRSIGVVDSGVKTEMSTPMEVDSRIRNVKPDESDVIGREGSKGQQRVNQGLTTLPGEVPSAPQHTPVSHTTSGTHHHPGAYPDNDPSRTFVYSEEERPGQPKVNLQRPKGLEEDPDAPKGTRGGCTPGNYQTKVTDFTGKGGEEAVVNPIADSLDKMSIYDELKPKSGEELSLPTGIEKFYSRVSTGSHDQFSPELYPPTRTSMDDNMNSYHDSKPKSVQEQNLSAATTGSHHDRFSPELSAPKAKGMTTEDDKMNIYDEQNAKSGQGQKLPTGTEDFYTPVPTGSHGQYSPEFPPTKNANNEEHPKESTNDRPSNQSSYTAKISSATSAIADKAISAKNVVASKLGYGQKGNTGEQEMHEGDRSGMPASAVDYGKKIAATVTQKLNPVYERVAGAGGTVVSKMQGTGSIEGQDRRVSVKDYFAEKLRPGEEDRALSEVISETLHKRKAEQDTTGASRGVSEAISDALHKRKGGSEEADRPMGKVTESEEVARRLGTSKNDSSNEGNGMDSSSVNSPGKGVVEKIKGAVGSWFGKGEESQQSLGSTIGSPIEETGQESGVAEERRLQQSGN